LDESISLGAYFEHFENTYLQYYYRRIVVVGLALNRLEAHRESESCEIIMVSQKPSRDPLTSVQLPFSRVSDSDHNSGSPNLKAEYKKTYYLANKSQAETKRP
jgi:hypothetical protein